MTIRRSDSVAISSITARWSGFGSRRTVCKRRHEWHLQAPQKLQNMCACRASKNSILVLQADQIDLLKFRKSAACR